jgi:hypothetical protein
MMHDYIRIDEILEEQWLLSYIELLRRFKLYELATEIAQYVPSTFIQEQIQVIIITMFPKKIHLFSYRVNTA